MKGSLSAGDLEVRGESVQTFEKFPQSMQHSTSDNVVQCMASKKVTDSEKNGQSMRCSTSDNIVQYKTSKKVPDSEKVAQPMQYSNSDNVVSYTAPQKVTDSEKVAQPMQQSCSDRVVHYTAANRAVKYSALDKFVQYSASDRVVNALRYTSSEKQALPVNRVHSIQFPPIVAVAQSISTIQDQEEVIFFFYPLPKVEGSIYRFGVVRPAVCLSVRLSVCLSQTCWGYISKTITDLNIKLQG